MKSVKQTFAFATLALMILVMPALAGGGFSGTWTLAPSEQPGMVQLGIERRSESAHMQTRNDWPVNAFHGLDPANSTRRDATFSVQREAGRIDFDGQLDGHLGAGRFTFAADPQYLTAMRAMGFVDIDEDVQFAMAVHDVSVAFARQMKAEQLEGLDAGKLIAFRIFGVDAKVMRELREAGLPAREADKLVAFRVHGVTPAFVREIRGQGIEADEDELIAFRVHGVTPEFIENLKGRGLKTLTARQLVSLKVHRIE